MAKWECSHCGYVHDGKTPPEQCPICKAEEEDFELLDPQTEEENDYDDYDEDEDY